MEEGRRIGRKKYEEEEEEEEDRRRLKYFLVDR